MAVTADSIYQLIKSFEGRFAPPAPYVTINVGTLDINTGAFTGLTTTSETDPEPLPHGPHDTPRNPPPRYQGEKWVSITIDARWRRTTTLTPAPKVPLNPVLLGFSVSGPVPDGWSVDVNGETITVAPGQTSLSADIWDSEIAVWTIRVGDTSHTDTIRIQHPGVVVGAAVGAFMIPALPVTIVYAPPADSLMQSTATYTQGQTVGTTLTMDWGTDTSRIVPGHSAFADGATFKAALDKMGTIVKAAGSPGVAAAISAISGQIGQLSSTETSGITDLNELQMTVTKATATALSTSAAVGGPGTGDNVHYFHNLRMAWAYLNGRLRLCPLGYHDASVPVMALQQHLPTIGLSPEDAGTLLALDPFVSGGPATPLPADRFEQRTTWEYGFGAKIHLTDTVTRDTKSQTTHTEYTTKTDDWEPGPILKFLGFGGGKDQTTIKGSNATGNDVSTTIILDANLVSGPSDYFVVNVWYDRLFGTFAFQLDQPAPSPRLRGQGTQPLQEVTVVAGGKVFRTITDQRGMFAFFARAMPVGHAVLTIGDRPSQAVEVAP